MLAPRMHILMKTTSLTGEQMPKIERSGLAAKSKEELIEMILFTSGILDRADKLIASYSAMRAAPTTDEEMRATVAVAKEKAGFTGTEQAIAINEYWRRRMASWEESERRAKEPDFWCAFDHGEVKVIGDEPRNALALNRTPRQ